MATPKKGKKKPTPKKGSKPKKKSKKNTSGNVFSKMMLFILLIAVLATAVFMVLTNIKPKAKDKDRSEITITKEKNKDEKKNINNEQTKEVKKEVKKEEVTSSKVSKNDTPIVKEEESKTEPKEVVIDLKKTFKENQTLSGCWFSTTQGSALTMDEYGYRIDFSGVDASKPITGKYSVDGNQIIFLNDSSTCKGIEGVYKITFNKKNISLTCKDDDCKERKNVLETDWEWIEI